MCPGYLYSIATLVFISVSVLGSEWEGLTLLSEHTNEIVTSFSVFSNELLSDAMSAQAFLGLFGWKCQGLGTCRHSSLPLHTRYQVPRATFCGVWDQLCLQPTGTPGLCCGVFQALPLDFHLGS